MCGIVGYSGNRKATPILVEGLKKLEYRGYDSAGVAVIEKGSINLTKVKGRLANLEEELKKSENNGNVGIGHTRWATHGAPSVLNAHPHLNDKNTIAVVHNGIIENYMELRKELSAKGYKFLSETDTEVIPHLIDSYYDGDLLKAVMKAAKKLRGSYAIAVVCTEEPDKVVAVRKDSPLIVGLKDGENFVASDIPAVLSETRDVYLLNDNEFVLLTKDGVELFSEDGQKITKDVYHVTWNADAAEKGGYDHFMLKEIFEQPKVTKDTMTSRIIAGQDIKLDKINLTKEQIENIQKVYIVACGTAYHAGIVGKYAIERLARIPVEVDIASEFRYRNPIINDKTLVIIVSQSGETADTLAALRLAKNHGARVIAVTNVVGSTISREAHDILYTWAGPEIAVASTKAYTTQLVAMYIIALYFAKNMGTLSNEEIEALKKDLLEIPEKETEILKKKEEIEKLAKKICNEDDMFYLGRGFDYAVAMEGSLKLKEISYIHSEAYAGGELKHGPIALIEDGTVVLALATQDDLFEKMVSNIKEVKTRGARVVAVAFEGNTDIENTADEVIYLPRVNPLFAPLVSILPLQLLSYYISIAKGCDVDKPRNLAKSVTVE